MEVEYSLKRCRALQDDKDTQSAKAIVKRRKRISKRVPDLSKFPQDILVSVLKFLDVTELHKLRLVDKDVFGRVFSDDILRHHLLWRNVRLPLSQIWERMRRGFLKHTVSLTLSEGKRPSFGEMDGPIDLLPSMKCVVAPGVNLRNIAFLQFMPNVVSVSFPNNPELTNVSSLLVLRGNRTVVAA